jgi:hypothetical protein
MIFWFIWAPIAVGALLLTLSFIMNVGEVDIVGLLVFGCVVVLMWYALLVPFLY